MNNNPHISVVVAAYNEEKDLPACLLAIVNQTYPRENYEIIVVDNNSTDRTAEIAQSFGAKVIKEQRQGNTFALSKGTKSANGDIIAMTDADTKVASDWLENVDRIFQDEKVVAATGTANISTKSLFFNSLSEIVWEIFVKFNFLIGKPHITGFNLMVRRSALEQVGGVNESFTMSSDIDLGLRIAKVGKVVFSNKLKAVTSIRRWQENPLKTINTYIKGYLWTVWFRKPPPVRQNVIR